VSSAQDVGISPKERLKMGGVSVHPEGPSMNPEAGRLSTTNVLNAAKAAENQNGSY